MPKQRKPRQADPNIVAKSMIDAIAAKTEGRAMPEAPDAKPKNAAAVELGRLGGLKGGKARAEKLSQKKRESIARRASKARWNSSGKP